MGTSFWHGRDAMLQPVLSSVRVRAGVKRRVQFFLAGVNTATGTPGACPVKHVLGRRAEDG